MEQTSEEVRRVVMRVAHHIDRKRWAELRSLYADEVETDYTSLFGGTPQKQTGDALIAGWKSVLGNVATQHLLGPIDVDDRGGTAEAYCHVRALHHAPKAAGGAVWEVLGHYAFKLVRASGELRITHMRLETFAQTGNTKLLSEASS